MAAVEVVAILGQACEVHDAEQRGVAGPVGVVGGGFAQVVEARPGEFTDAPGQVIVLDEVVFRQVRPGAAFHIVGRGLMVGVSLHLPPCHGKFVHAARADGGGGLAAQYELLGQAGVSFRVFVGAVVKAGYVQRGRHVVDQCLVGRVQPRCDGAGRVFAVAYVAQGAGYLRAEAAIGPLLGYLVADAPHDDAGVVAELPEKIDQVSFSPLVEQTVVAVGAFGQFPLVERLGHEHHAHLVAGLHQFRGGHVVGGADGVAAHVPEDAYLSADGRIVDRRTQRAEVVVQAYAFEAGLLAVEEETLVGHERQRADAEHGGAFVRQLRAVVDGRLRRRALAFRATTGGARRPPASGRTYFHRQMPACRFLSATVWPWLSFSRVTMRQSDGRAPPVSNVVRTRTFAYSRLTTGVVSCTPHTGTCTARLTRKWTWRYSPAPGYQREDSGRFSRRTASTLVSPTFR